MQGSVVAALLKDQGERFPKRCSRFSVFLFHSRDCLAVATIAKGIAIFLMTSCALVHASTYRVSPAQSYSAIQRVISSASPGDTISFSAGKYNASSGFELKCGVTYTGPVATPPTAVLSASFTRGSKDIFNLAPGCKSPTTIQYLWFQNAGGIFVITTNANITITRDLFTGLPCCASQAHSPAIYFDGGRNPKDPNAQILSNATVTWNTFGDPTSCITPDTEPMFSYTADTAGNCAGIIVQSTTKGMTISNNNFIHLGEGVHFLCVYGPSGCEPPTTVTTSNVTAQFNDFSGIHRMGWEEQPQPTENILFEYNSFHDPFHPFHGTFDLSLACCNSGATVPGVIVENNVLIQNVPTGPPPAYIGYGIEAGGNGARYNNNLVEGLNNAPMIAWSVGKPPWEIKNNYICSPVNKQFIKEEGNWRQTMPTQVGNVTSAKCAAIASAGPAISPGPSGTYDERVKVTLTDDGLTQGPGPRGNTSIYYTTDGSIPTTASNLYTAPFFVMPGATVKAIGMWGSGANPEGYPPGYGFVPSAVQSAYYAPSKRGGTR
jgi:Chitobiase/beta-hexosaminidase C-terminal domain